MWALPAYCDDSKRAMSHGNVYTDTRREVTTLNLPALAVMRTEHGVRSLGVAAFQRLRIPIQGLASAVGHTAQQHRLAQRSGVVEVAGRWSAGLAGFDPLLVVADRVRDRRSRW